jgi:hypothetical protein
MPGGGPRWHSGRVPAFVPGLDLGRALYAEAVRPIMAAEFPALAYSAALIGPGSEVLGLDTERSTDHDWGPRLQVFLADPGPAPEVASEVAERLAHRLPRTVRGYPVHFGPAASDGTRTMAATVGPVAHRVEVAGRAAWWRGRLGFDPAAGVGLLDWLATPTQALAEVTGGVVFHDGLGELGAARDALRWYPEDVWRYVLAGQWRRVAQEEPFVGRAGEVGDDLGSAVVTARLVRDLMRLCLLLARRYPPYAKWLGSAFGRLPVAGALGPELSGALAATGWHAREDHLCRAYRLVGAAHDATGLTAPVDATPRQFYDRPYRVLFADRYVEALRPADPVLAALPPLGAVDSFVDSTDAAGDPALRRRLVAAALRLP